MQSRVPVVLLVEDDPGDVLLITEALERAARPPALYQVGDGREAMERLRVVAAAIAVVGNADRSGQVSAGQMPDGVIELEIGEVLRHQLAVTSQHLSLLARPTQKPRAVLRFSDLETAGAVLSGEISAVAAMSAGQISMRGMISMVDNVNRILDRAAQYLEKA